MIHITYSPENAQLAEEIRADLGKSGASVPGPLLIVLVSRAANADPAVQAEIKNAQRAGRPILPLLTERVALPPALEKALPLDFSAGYQRSKLLRHLTPAAMTPGDLRRANRRALVFIALVAIVMFSLAIAAISAGLVAFPVVEYNEEATFQALWIDGLIRETLEHVQPRSTEDAQNFAATHEAAPTRLYYYIRGTATALANAPGA